MKILNESGITKVVKYLGEDHCRHIKIDGNDFLLGLLSEDDHKMLNDININLNSVGDLLYEVSLDEPELDVEKDEEIEDAHHTFKSSEEKMQNMAKELAPYLDKYFANKNEVNKVLSALQAQMIDPDEMIDGLRMRANHIKKNSRKDDEIG